MTRMFDDAGCIEGVHSATQSITPFGSDLQRFLNLQEELEGLIRLLPATLQVLDQLALTPEVTRRDTNIAFGFGKLLQLGGETGHGFLSQYRAGCDRNIPAPALFRPRPR